MKKCSRYLTVCAKTIENWLSHPDDVSKESGNAYSVQIRGVGSDWKIVLVISVPCHEDRDLVLSSFIGIIGALGLVLWELRNAPIGYESEDGFHFGERHAERI